MDTKKLAPFMEQFWEKEILPTLTEYIYIPNKSPDFDADWARHGHMDKAVALFEGWAREKIKALPGSKLEVVRLENRTPLILIEVPGQVKDTVLLYGHLDKQPEMKGWTEGTGPWTPVRKDDKLFGRGGADDGYAMFAAISALLALKEQNVPHARAVIVIEACEESGSPDLPAYIDHLSGRIGTPSLVVCLDSGCGNYDQLWLTTSLRGIAMGRLNIRVLTEGVHSGDASGIVPSSFRILRQLLARVDDPDTGRVRIEGLHVQVPPERLEQAKATAQVLGDELFDKFPFVAGARPVSNDRVDMILNRTWRPALSITGVDGLPPLGSAGNVLRPHTAVKLSLRIPPRLEPGKAARLLKETLEKDPPYGAKVTFTGDKSSTGWDAPPLSPWLTKAIEKASKAYFGKPPMAMGEGGTIPFMGMLGEKFPEAQFLITGVLGPGSNAHGPNEFLHIPTGKKLTACVASVVADHFERK